MCNSSVTYRSREDLHGLYGYLRWRHSNDYNRRGNKAPDPMQHSIVRTALVA